MRGAEYIAVKKSQGVLHISFQDIQTDRCLQREKKSPYHKHYPEQMDDHDQVGNNFVSHDFLIPEIDITSIDFFMVPQFLIAEKLLVSYGAGLRKLKNHKNRTKTSNHVIPDLIGNPESEF